ncbi:penicillin-binding transpeptidase domain-containing protein [Tumebacillus sp. ITR2]|uniref:Penicillin-binding transpeptidase domain-containing protein n=1 Tax=Tumebacillus amylolyticus TaxID=2801339 RepID=A0ABS1J7D7_9BACL|nr:penicillin-binding transpeptidase domain-containing protein [Tumebacillus amylolyticus]MBL0386196.1 penicillin-binding transpeptidase domain-containing protein [Tumebacillus amylolyticus]
MKKRKRIWLLIALCLTAGSVGTVYAVTADSEEAAVKSFLNNWNRQQYAQMYEGVSSDVKQSMTQEQFVNRYQSIYEGVEAKDVNVQLVSMGDQDSFRFHVQMNTLAGPLQFEEPATAVQEGRHWKIQWKPSFLIPDLQAGEKVSANVLQAERGQIVDRHGRGLAINDEQLSIGVVPSALTDETITKMATLLHMNTQTIQDKLHAAWVKPDLFVPIKVLPQTDMLVPKLTALPGVTTQKQKVRAYPLGEAAAHLIGYTGDDGQGKAGLEKLLNDRLSGRNGGRITIQTADGITKQTVAEKKPLAGEAVQLTLDAKLQENVYEQLHHELGAGVALHPLTGEVLAMVSTPSYDPNEMAHGVTDEQWKSWNEDPNHPFLNRFADDYPPGSAFKPLVAAMALDTNIITPQETHEIPGKQWQKSAAWGDYYVTRVSDTYIQVDLEKALIASDNIYFAQTALKMGEKSFTDEAMKFGFGEKLPLLYPFDLSALANSGMKNDIQLADSGYGQGEVLMTPMHVAAAYTAFSNEGNMLTPYLFAKEAKKVWKPNAIQPDVARLIEQDLVQVIDNPNGTGHGAKIDGMTLAGKTGTAELKQTQNTTGKELGWFVAYDTQDPHLLVTLMVENVQGRGGSHLLASKMRTLFQEYGERSH